MTRILFTAAILLSTSSLLLIDATIKGGAILALAGCVALLLRRDSAATRHLLWLVAVAAIMVVPLFSALLPQWRVLPEWAVISLEQAEPVSVETDAANVPTVDAAWDGSESFPSVSDSTLFPAAEVARPLAAEAKPETSTRETSTKEMAEAKQSVEADSVAPETVFAESAPTWNWSATLTVVWLFGLGMLVIRLLAARLMLWSSERRGTVVCVSGTASLANTDSSNESLISVFEVAAGELGISQRVSLMLHPDRTIPIVWGLWKARLLLPVAARDWTTEQQKSVLLHELAHVKRRDTWTQLLAQIACATYWFNPLVWFAAWRLHVEREQACDDMVLNSGVPASTYAAHLLNVATRLTSSPWTQACGLAMARRSSLEGRLMAVLNEKRNRRKVTNLIIALTLLIGGAIAVPVAMLRAAGEYPAAAESEPSDEKDEDEIAALRDNSPEPGRSATAKPLPKHEHGVNLLHRWQALEDRETLLKNSTVERMRRAIDSWIRQPPLKPDADKVLALRDWELGRDEHPVEEVVAWLDQIASINPQPIQFAINGEKRVSRSLTVEELNALMFGPTAGNGMRAAWGRSAVSDVYEIGDVVATTLVIQNTTEEPLEFQCPYDLSSIVRWDVTGENERKVKVEETRMRGSVPLVTFHVKPGQVAEILGYGGLTIGEIEPRPIRRLNARAGERVTVRWQVRKPFKMTTGPVSFTVQAKSATSGDEPSAPDAKANSPKPIAASKLPADIEESLQWGTPVNGLRAALSRLPSVGEQLTGQVLDFHLVLQNVSNAPVRVVGDKASPNTRKLSILKDGKIQVRLAAAESLHMDEVLQPGEAVTFAFVKNDEIIGKSLAEDPELTFYGMIKVEKAPAGAWTGELQTPEVSGAVISGKQLVQKEDGTADEPEPKPGGKLSNAIVKKLRWGKTVNGLRAAMMIRDTPEVLNELFIVLQNVSQTPLHINDSAGENEHSLILRFDGVLESVLSGKEPKFGNVLLQPQEVVVAPALPPSSKKIKGMTIGSVMAANLFHDPSMSYNAEVKFENVPAGTWKGTLTTGNSTGMDAAPPDLQLGRKLPVGEEQRLQWGEPSNGLRAALAIRNSPGDSSTPDLYLAVQNVKDVPIRLNDIVAAEGQRYLIILREDLLQSQTRIDQPTMANVLLRPRDVAFLLMAPKLVPDDAGEFSKGQLMAKGLLKVPQMRLMAEMTVAKARPGGWTGKLVTGITGAAEAKEGPIPKSKTAQVLFKKWVANARLSGKIPGGQLKSLAKATSNFVGYNKQDKRAPQLAKLLKRMDVTRDWTQEEAVALLDELTDVYDSLPQWASDISRFSISDVVTTGQSLPKELKNAPWGEAHECGLRTAWLLDPVAKAYRLNTPLKSRILYHNSGTETVFFRVVSWNQSGSHQAHDSGGRKIETVSTSWTTIGQVQAVRLAPGEFTEVIGAGIGVGANIDGEVWRNTRVGTWIHAAEGADVTFTPDAVTISGSDGRQRDVKDEVWWLTFITERLQRDAPLPDNDNERKQILDRAVGELFGTPPTADEIKTLLADKSPDALTSLAERLTERTGTRSVYGSLQSGPTSFQVLPVDPDAKYKPYMAVGPGRYKFDNGTTLVIVGRGEVTDAKLEFSGDNAPKPFPIRLPERGKWAIAWKPEMQEFWVAEMGGVRIVDISVPQQISERRYDGELPIDVPNPIVAKFFYDALRPTFAPDPPAPAAAAAEVVDEDIEKKSLTNEGTGDDILNESIDQEESADAPPVSKVGPVRSANRSNHYSLSKDRRLTMCRPTNNQPWMTIHWPESADLPRTMRRIEPKLRVENYRNWAAVWEANGDDIWFVDDECFARVNISSPAEVLVTRQKHKANAILEFKMPEIVKAEFARLGFPVDTYPASFEVTDGQEMLTSVLTELFKVSGTVTGANGQAIANVPIRVRTALSPSVDIATATTDESGRYRVSFRLDLRTIARYRGIIVGPVLDGFTERGYCASGMFEALLRPDEQPQHVKVRDYPPKWLTGVSAGDYTPGPISRFGDRDLIIGRPSVADFVLLPASVITGTLVDLDGTPLVGHSVSVTAPDAEVPRGYGMLAHAVTDDNGQFTLKDVPANELINFHAASAGKPGDRRNQESATQVFGNAATHRVRIEADYGVSRKMLKIERFPTKM